MATAKKSSPDYDPIEEALDIGHRIGVQTTRERQKPRVEAARRGGERHGQARARREAEEARQRRARKTREANARMRASRAARQEEATAAARRGAYRSGQAAARRAQADAARQARATQPSPSSGQLRAPNFSVPGTSGLGGGGGFDRVTTSRVIVVAVAISAIGVVARDAIAGGVPTKTVVKVGKDTVTVPTHLRSLGGVFIMGTIALLVNEFDPGVGLVLGLGLLFDVGLSTMTGRDGLFARVGGGLFAKTQPKPGAIGKAVGTGAGNAERNLQTQPTKKP